MVICVLPVDLPRIWKRRGELTSTSATAGSPTETRFTGREQSMVLVCPTINSMVCDRPGVAWRIGSGTDVGLVACAEAGADNPARTQATVASDPAIARVIQDVRCSNCILKPLDVLVEPSGAN